jgi:hypothetical protein
MLIIYNLSGLILAGAGIVAGLFVVMVTGWISPGLLTLAVIWFAGGLWWRHQEVSPGVKRPFPALFFIPLPILAIPAASLAVLGFLLVEWGAHTQPADGRAELFRADLPSHVPVQRTNSSDVLGAANGGAQELPRQGASRVQVERPDKEQLQPDEPEAVKSPDDNAAPRAKTEEPKAAASPEDNASPRAKTEDARAAKSADDRAAARAKKKEDAQAERARQESKREMERAERKKRSDERMAELKKRSNEQVATAKLQLAESLRKAGVTDDYRKTLKEIVEKYPETEAGKKAKKLLKR